MPLRLKINLVPGFSYTTATHEFPVDIVVSTEAPTEIYSRVDVSAALLTKIDSETTFGYVMRVTPAKRQLIPLLPQEPIRMRINVFEHDDDFEDYRAGCYRCDIKVEVGEKVGEDVRYLVLEGSVEVGIEN